MNEIARMKPAGHHVTPFVDRTADPGPLNQTPKFGESTSRHHRPHFDDYDVARLHVLQAIGDISDMDLFGRQVLVAVFARPNVRYITMPDGTINAIYTPLKEAKEDWWQGKACLLLKTGPEAFKGEKSYLDAMFGGMPPKPGDWLFANAAAGMQISLYGDGGSRPQGHDHRGKLMDIYEWDGWPCRVYSDDQFFGRIAKPHSVI